ncbi:uncharacterized protein PHALS_05635 [Plasmopara halstedii]|uniref:Uncharacterized protein n=1 Tax=Plasmopara halstedii TaxID=4781 RepID=A0A0P1B2X5_PLAHL|nr:uncharacterized protein PHALS_05635 [Plasmopara halstedii]CEG48164.1 hypothetical protein PHALS_05635 [Plasmopara halstedii]|eukprot:XP_024584533.1 hypothetical protein PHALS_05635 [Plasmopara halstedii]
MSATQSAAGLQESGFTSWQKRYTVEDIALSARRNVMQKQQSNAKALRDNSIFNVAD